MGNYPSDELTTTLTATTTTASSLLAQKTDLPNVNITEITPVLKSGSLIIKQSRDMLANLKKPKQFLNQSSSTSTDEGCETDLGNEPKGILFNFYNYS